MMENTDISKLRRDYLFTELDENKVKVNPFDQFNLWMEEAIRADLIDPSAMILATANKNAFPTVRVVLLKGIDEEGFIFYTNYESKKGKDILENPQASLLFFWKELERQIRISGKVKKVSEKESENYFHSRPYESQLAALASKQSSVIPSRKHLENKFDELKNNFSGKEIPLPPFWGGFKLVPESFEYWQGRENRLHDRISYLKEKNNWKIVRLAP
jgi:pyridoxamine 5'-phosphate oxidase